MKSPAVMKMLKGTIPGQAAGAGGGAALLKHLLFGDGMEMLEAVAMADDTDAAIQNHVSNTWHCSEVGVY